MRILLPLTAALVMAVSGCGSGEPSVTTGELFEEYVGSTDVENDRFPDTGGSGEDRKSNFAAYYSADQLIGTLLRAYECDGREAVNPAPAHPCRLTGPVEEAAADFAGSGTKPLGRSVLVKHGDGSLEMLILYVVRASDGRARLIDGTGRTYTGLEDFRSRNDLLGSDDTMLTLRDITSVPGSGDIVTVTGHTAWTWQWWLIGGLAAALTAGAVVIVLRRRVRRRL